LPADADPQRQAAHEEFIFCDMGAAQFWIDPNNPASQTVLHDMGTVEGG
jgi:hypothetical protein